MLWLKEHWKRVKHLFNRGERFDDDLAEEMRLHLELRTAENPDAARRVRIRFGNLARIQEESCAAWRWPMLDSIFQDVRYGVRTLAGNPAFTITAVVSLTLAIGANTAVFSLLNAIFLRELPVKDPAQLVSLRLGDERVFPTPVWERISKHQSAFDGTLAYRNDQFDLSSGGERQFVRGMEVSGDFFQTLGVPAFQGRPIKAEDDKHGCGDNGPVAVISQRFWRNHFKGDPFVIGRTLNLDHKPFQIIGVTPDWFTGLDIDSTSEVAIPIGCFSLYGYGSLEDKQTRWWNIVGRLKPGITKERALEQLRPLDPDLAQPNKPLDLQPASTGFSALRRYSQAFLALQAVVALVLLIACANLANLLLAGASARQRELSVRLAIGAGRLRIIRQLLTESLLLAGTGAVAGVMLALWGTRLSTRLLSPTRNAVELDTSLDLTVVSFTVLLVVTTTLFFGLLPALRASSAAPNGLLKQYARGSVTGGGRRQFRLAKAMMAVQLGLALTLLLAAGLFGTSFLKLPAVEPGFDSRNVVLVPASLPQEVPIDRATRVFSGGLDRLRRVPGIRAASRSARTPLQGGVWQWSVFPHGRQSKADREIVYFNCASSGYFETVGAKLIAGRDFEERDSLTAHRVIVIDDAAAHAFWGSENPIGRSLIMRAPDKSGDMVAAQVIGVVKNMKYSALSETPHPSAFVPLSQVGLGLNETWFEVRVDPEHSLARVIPLARAALTDTDKNLSLEFQTFDSQVSDSLIQPRLLANIAGFFGVVALILAATGLYGVISYSTARRKAEIGLRMALGASHGNVLWLVLKETGLTLSAGAAFGLTTAYFAARLVKSLVFGVQPTDPAVLAAALATLMATAAFAAYIPARRAARSDPMESLRIE